MTSIRTRKAGARDRLVAAAERLFYAEGIHAVGVDRLCAEAEVSKRSLYQHFSGKDEVVTAMLQAQAAKSAAHLEPGDGSPRERILAVFDALDQAADSSDFRGCPFLGAATELKDRDHPAVQVAREQKTALTEYFAQALRAAASATRTCSHSNSRSSSTERAPTPWCAADPPRRPARQWRRS